MADYDWKNGDPLTNWVVMSAVDDAEQRSSDIEIDGSVSRPDDLTEIDTGVNSRLADLMGEGGMKSPNKGTIDDVYDKVDSIGDWQSQRVRYKLLQRQVLNINGGLTTANVGTYHSLNGGSDDAKGAEGMVACLPLETMVKSAKAFGLFKSEGQRVSFDELITLMETPAFLHDAQKWQDLEGDVYAVAVGSEHQLQGDAQVDDDDEDDEDGESKEQVGNNEQQKNAEQTKSNEQAGSNEQPKSNPDETVARLKAEGKMTEDGFLVMPEPEKDPNAPERHFKGRIDEETKLIVFDEVDEDGNVIMTAEEMVGAKPKEPAKPAFNGPTKANPQFDPNNTTDKYKMVYDEDSKFFEGVENPYYKPDPGKPMPKLELIDVEEPKPEQPEKPAPKPGKKMPRLELIDVDLPPSSEYEDPDTYEYDSKELPPLDLL